MISEDVGQSDPTVPAGLLERDLACFKQPDQSGARNAQHLRCLTGSDHGLMRSDRYGQAVRHSLDHFTEHLEYLSRKLEARAVRSNQGSAGTPFRPQQTQHLGEAVRVSGR